MNKGMSPQRSVELIEGECIGGIEPEQSFAGLKQDRRNQCADHCWPDSDGCVGHPEIHHQHEDPEDQQSRNHVHDRGEPRPSR